MITKFISRIIFPYTFFIWQLSFVANVIAASWLTEKEFLFVSHFLSASQIEERDTKRPYQRAETCNEIIKNLTGLALEALKATNFYDESVQKSATEFAELAVADLIEHISSTEEISNSTRDMLKDKLKSTKYMVMYPSDILNLTKIAGLYDELDFEGNETLPELYVKLNIHHNKLQVQPEEHWAKILDDLIWKSAIQYHFNESLLC